ncbi:Kinesin-like protein kif2a, variant 2 [Basidiobolus ranarum]
MRALKTRQNTDETNVSNSSHDDSEGYYDSGPTINNEVNLNKSGGSTSLLRPVRGRMGLPPPSAIFKTNGKSSELSSEEPNKPEALIIPSSSASNKEEVTPRFKSSDPLANSNSGSKNALSNGRKEIGQAQKSPIPTRNKVNVNPSKTALAIDKMKQEREERRKRFAEARVQKQQQQGESFEVAKYVEMINEIRSELDTKIVRSRRKSIGNCGTSAAGKDVSIQVCVRKRPLSGKESNSYAFDIATSAPSKNRSTLSKVYIHEPKCRLDLTKTIETQWFDFDEVFDENSTNMQIYRAVGKPLVEKLFEGGNSTLFAYGQTGSGKTHTIFGSSGGQSPVLGVYEYVCRDLFRMKESYEDDELTVSMCFFEIYGGKVFDLFGDKASVNILEDGNGNVQVVGLNEICVASLDEMLKCIERGNQSRTTASTEANATSSRSHAIFQIIIHNSDHSTLSKFSLIDLAGSERSSESGSTSKQSQFEGAEINKSLLALKECIRALSIYGDSKNGHVPFRASKLTQVLRDALTGPRSNTVVIANISPSSLSCEHTLNTLRYAGRVKDLKSGTMAYNPGKKINKQYPGPGPETPTSISEEHDENSDEDQITLSSGDTDSDEFSNVKEEELVTPNSADATNTSPSMEVFPQRQTSPPKPELYDSEKVYRLSFKQNQINPDHQTPNVKTFLSPKTVSLRGQEAPSPDNSPLANLSRRVHTPAEQIREANVEKGSTQIDEDIKEITAISATPISKTDKTLRSVGSTNITPSTTHLRNKLRKPTKSNDATPMTPAYAVSVESPTPSMNTELQESLDRLLKQQAYAMESVNRLSDQERKMFEEINRTEEFIDYPNKLEEILTEKIAVLTAFKDLVAGFKQKSRQAVAWENLRNAGLE